MATNAAHPAPRPAIDRLLRPRSVAIAGVSATSGSLGGNVLDNLERFGFPGAIHLLHPTKPEVRGRVATASVAALPFGVDCVVLAIPVTGILPAVRDCAANGVGGIVIFAAGFAELGPEGRAAQEEIGRIGRAAGMAVEGPNCLGYVNYVDGVPLTFAITEPRPIAGPGIAVASQSGAMASVVRAALHGRDLPVSLSVSTGNEAANGLEDFLDHLIADPATRMIAIVAEHIRDPRRFLALADSARARGIPLVMLHPGRSTAAAAAARTHTGALTGDHAMMRVQSERRGIVMVDTLEELVDLADIVMRCRHMPRGGVAVLGESGAFKALTLDYAETLGLALPQPEGEAAAALDAVAPGFIVAGNPLDLTAQALGDPGLYGRTIDLLLASPDAGALLVVIILTSAQMAARKMPPVIAAMTAAAEHHAVLFAMLGEDTPIPDDIVAAVRAAGVPFLRSPERALRALARMEPRFGDERAAPVPPAARLPAGVIAEHAAKDILAAAGLPMPARRLVATRDEAMAAARALGGTVALKVQSAALSHKSDIGGVILGLAGDAAVGDGWDRLRANLAAHAAGAAIDGVLVEAMAPPGLELIVGAKNDPDWGPAIVVGLGGVTAEALGDVRILPADLGVAAIEKELRRLNGAALLGPFRGRPARDVAAVAGTVAALGRFLMAHDEIAELDINPLMVFEEGRGVLALDALIACR